MDKKKTEIGLNFDIVDKLQVDGFDINNCQEQCFDNRINMVRKINSILKNKLVSTK